MRELLGGFLGVLQEPGDGVGVDLEFDQGGGLIQGDFVSGGERAGEFAVGDLDAGLNDRLTCPGYRAAFRFDQAAVAEVF